MAFDRENLDKQSVKVAGIGIPLRTAIVLCSVATWIGMMLLYTGKAGLASLWTTVTFCGILLILTTPTRTVSMRRLLAMFLSGGFMLSVVVILGNIAKFLGQAPSDLLVAILEEAAFLIPPLVHLWRKRQHGLWNLGATDIFLLFTACGAGLGMVETAYLMKAQSMQQVSWLPVVAVVGDRIHGEYLMTSHEVWAGLAGQGLGLALMLQHNRKAALACATAGIGLGVLDHFVVDFRLNRYLSPLANMLAAITWNGYLASLVFIAGTVAVVAFDWHVINRKSRPELQALRKQLKWWTPSGCRALLSMNALAFANYKLEHAPAESRPIIATSMLAVLNEPQLKASVGA